MSTHPVADDGLHPRPQLRRAAWTDLGGAWGFAHDDADAGRDAGWHRDPAPFDRTITVPFPPESAASGIHDTAYHPVVWYRRTLRLSADDLHGDRVLLHFGAVDYRASVWVDGTHVGDHEGGMTPFSFDVTAALTAGADEHTVVVRAEDLPWDAEQPRGKQDWQDSPHVIWYHRTTGIWQPVWLEVVPGTHVAELCWTSDIDGASVRLESLLRRPVRRGDGRLVMRVGLRLGTELLAEQSAVVTDDRVVMDIALPALRNGQDRDRLLWSPHSPTLVDADIVLLDRDADGVERPVDEVASYLGIRTAEVADGRFLLNGRPYYLRMVLEQGYWPESHLAAPDAGALRREVELIKELGFNGARVHQKVEDPRFLHWCDRLGLLVWGEMAGAFAFGPEAVRRLTTEWMDVVRRDRGHPSVVSWVPFNESWGVQDIAGSPAQRAFVEGVVQLTRALDPSRPVISNDGWEMTDSDMWTIHDYAGTGRELGARYGTAGAVEAMLTDGRPGGRRVVLDPDASDPRGGRPVLLTEFGGLSYRPEGEEWFGYSTVTSPAELRSRLDELFRAVTDSPELAGFCYTQLTDTEQETNGLLTAERRAKLPVEEIRRMVGRPSAAMPTEALDRHRREVEEANQQPGDTATTL
ncbi:sugar-binding domain-containing protein [Streptomyces sp. NPDC006132]|uniref:sugar-binding domain-containing protein n=1 Tax=Streptomyces sp. NPDC006132 TaxID=3156732 RepID=UPI0033ED9C3F